MKLSLVITAHDEGILAHKTMLSVFRALSDYSIGEYEIIVHIDNGTSETIAYYNRYKNDSRFRIFKNHFGDIGASRNYCVQRAKGDFVIFLDSDDLLSSNYIVNFLSKLESNRGKAIIHPAYNISFWDEKTLVWELCEAKTRSEAAFLLFSYNQWPSSCGASRELFLNNPYNKTGNGYGHEDYTLNIYLSDNNIKHLVADNTVYFYRQKPKSLLKSNESKNVTQPYCNLFNFDEWKKLRPDQADLDIKKNSFRENLHSYYLDMRNNQTINAFITPVATIAKKIVGEKLSKLSISNSAMQEWCNIASIETNLYPSTGRLMKATRYNPNAKLTASEAYLNLAKQIPQKPDYIFIVPWLMPGGADKVVLNYIKAIREVYPDWKVAVITTLASKNSWSHLLPDNSYLIDFGSYAKRMDKASQDTLFTRLIVQLQASRLHIINSLYGYQWANVHQDLIKNNYTLYISLFCHDIIPNTDGRGRFDYADPYAIRIYPIVDKIFTDNFAVINRLVELNAFDANKFRVHYQPTDDTKVNHGHKNNNSKLNILWASRIAFQKNPELLLRIAKQLNPAKAHIDIYGRKDKDCARLTFPRSLTSISYHGAFNGLGSIDLSKYDLLLYTSRIDGLPNILLEATAAGLPIVASDVGGVGDFIKNHETGFLITDSDNAEAYVKVLQDIQAHPEQLDQIVENAQHLLRDRHSWSHFMKQVKQDIK